MKPVVNVCHKCGKIITGKFTVDHGDIFCLPCAGETSLYDRILDDTLPLYPDIVDVESNYTVIDGSNDTDHADDPDDVDYDPFTGENLII